MSFFDFMRVYIFSEVDGVVLMNGEPVSGAMVARTADYRDKLYSHTATTDEQGRFHFDDIYTYSLRLSETAILQKIMIYYRDEEYLAWKLMKRNDIRFGELNDPGKHINPLARLNLTCELSRDQENEQIVGSEMWQRIIYGLSLWE